MTAVISLSAKLDVSQERANEINPIHGESLLLWIAERARGRLSMSEPAAEDWGWYSDVVWDGQPYMLGASASDEELDGSREWTLQVVKHRTLKERLLGTGKMSNQDECVQYVLEILDDEPSFEHVSLQ